MSRLPLLDPGTVAFPDPQQAFSDPNGLLAIGGALTPEWLLAAYGAGIFPWFDDDDGPILWWSPDPRAVLRPEALRITRSLAKRIRNGGFRVTLDCAFAEVIAGCAGPRDGVRGTWITPRMRAAYQQFHELGYAHSVEVWLDQELVGGLYGVSLGAAFFGESMFSRVPDASKVGLALLVPQLRRRGITLIDCQVMNPHLFNLGVRPLPRQAFLQQLAHCREAPARPGPWQFEAG